MKPKYIVSSLFMVTSFLVAPLVLHASHNENRSSDRKNINDLGGKIVTSLYIPVLFGVALDDVVPDFGDPRGDGTRSHEGQDLIAILGTPIVSPTKAVVTSVGVGESAGKFVYTANPGGEQFRYMHLDTVADLKVGDELAAGDFIGTLGDTGNAKGGVAHLHFEIKKNGTPIDPYPRLTDELTLKEKMALVKQIFSEIRNDAKMADFLVTNYGKEFAQALNEQIELPSAVKSALEESGVVDTSKLVAELNRVIKLIPTVLRRDLALNDQGVEVQLLQFYLIQAGNGTKAAALGRAGTTGYFGPTTAAALIEYQEKQKITPTGIFDAETRAVMSK